MLLSAPDGGRDLIAVWQEFSSLEAAQQAIGGVGEPLLISGGGKPYTGDVYVLDFFPVQAPATSCRSCRWRKATTQPNRSQA